MLEAVNKDRVPKSENEMNKKEKSQQQINKELNEMPKEEVSEEETIVIQGIDITPYEKMLRKPDTENLNVFEAKTFFQDLIFSQKGIFNQEINQYLFSSFLKNLLKVIQNRETILYEKRDFVFYWTWISCFLTQYGSIGSFLIVFFPFYSSYSNNKFNLAYALLFVVTGVAIWFFFTMLASSTQISYLEQKNCLNNLQEEENTAELEFTINRFYYLIKIFRAYSLETQKWIYREYRLKAENNHAVLEKMKFIIKIHKKQNKLRKTIEQRCCQMSEINLRSATYTIFLTAYNYFGSLILMILAEVPQYYIFAIVVIIILIIILIVRGMRLKKKTALETFELDRQKKRIKKLINQLP